MDANGVDTLAFRRALGRRIRRLRMGTGVPLWTFARMVGVSRNHLTLVESGEANPTVDVICKIAAGLGVTPSELLDVSIG